MHFEFQTTGHFSKTINYKHFNFLYNLESFPFAEIWALSQRWESGLINGVQLPPAAAAWEGEWPRGAEGVGEEAQCPSSRCGLGEEPVGSVPLGGCS